MGPSLAKWMKQKKSSDEAGAPLEKVKQAVKEKAPATDEMEGYAAPKAKPKVGGIADRIAKVSKKVGALK